MATDISSIPIRLDHPDLPEIAVCPQLIEKCIREDNGTPRETTACLANLFKLKEYKYPKNTPCICETEAMFDVRVNQLQERERHMRLFFKVEPVPTEDGPSHDTPAISQEPIAAIQQNELEDAAALPELDEFPLPDRDIKLSSPFGANLSPEMAVGLKFACQ